jgi:hypothetical protein
MVELYLYSPTGVHGVVLNYLNTRTTSPFTSKETLNLRYRAQPVNDVYCENHMEHKNNI